MFSNNRGETILPVKSDSDFGPGESQSTHSPIPFPSYSLISAPIICSYIHILTKPPVYWVASVRDTTYFVKLANYGSSLQTVDITIDGTTTGTLTVLSGAENESNYPYEANVVPVESTLNAPKGTFSLKLPAWSVAVLKAN